MRARFFEGVNFKLAIEIIAETEEDRLLMRAFDGQLGPGGPLEISGRNQDDRQAAQGVGWAGQGWILHPGGDRPASLTKIRIHQRQPGRVVPDADAPARDPRCGCTMEAGDSPCSIHGGKDET